MPYKRIYGIDEPATREPLANDGSLSPHLPAGTPFGLIGTSSFYKRESYPDGAVADGSVTATFAGGRDSNGYERLDPFNTSQNGASLNWFNQGSDAGRYSNEDIHAVRIIAMEPTTDRHHGPKRGRLFYSHAMERLRILGEIPLRKFEAEGKQPIDPDGNPDTSFLAKIPADTAFTFQTLDRNGMVLNAAQTWHQVRPGEIRHDCGGCHAHSQKPTRFEDTFAARDDYSLFDLTEQTPLIVTKGEDDTDEQWDMNDTTALRHEDAGVVNVEYFRDVQPILQRSCVACHTEKDGREPAGNLNLDADAETVNQPNRGRWPGTYYRLAADSRAKFGHKPVIHNGTWRQTNASRYIRKFQSRRSLLIWKVYGERLDGWANDDFPTAREPGNANTLELAGKPIPNTHANRDRSDLDFRGSVMPPRDAVESGKAKPLSDEDRRALVRWIDLGCPIDFDYDSANPDRRGFGWAADDKRPIVTLTEPRPGTNKKLTRILIGIADYYSGVDAETLSVVADFAVNGTPAGDNLAKHFKRTGEGILELKLSQPPTTGEHSVEISVKDMQGNVTRVSRVFRLD